MKSGLTHTICPTCRRRMGAKSYMKGQQFHAVLTRDGRLRCKWCGHLLSLHDDESEEDAA